MYLPQGGVDLLQSLPERCIERIDRAIAVCDGMVGFPVDTNLDDRLDVGAIIPAPLAIPASRTEPPKVSTLAEASFGTVSVVMIASAALPSPFSERVSTACWTPDSMGPIGRGTPMTPVELTRTSSGRIPRRSAAYCAVLRAFWRPCSPVHAFAFLLFTTIARACPSRRCSRLTCNGAACTRFVVKVPPALAARSETMIARSLPSGFRPQATPDARKPIGSGKSEELKRALA